MEALIVQLQRKIDTSEKSSCIDDSKVLMLLGKETKLALTRLSGTNNLSWLRNDSAIVDLLAKSPSFEAQRALVVLKHFEDVKEVEEELYGEYE